ncbi:MAG TPA: hypothetical protein VKV96_00950 [Roseiarcus sp.]|nr:hypothetical protein [Roseiarcus sp.]
MGLFMKSGAALVLAALVTAPQGATAKPPLAGCDAFIATLRKIASDLQVDFTHSIIVSRAKSTANVFDVTTNAEVDGTLTCRGDEMERFEARVAEPASARTLTNFERFETAALRAALGWDEARAQAKLREMSGDAREFLAASKERGDAYIAGKTEEHLPGAVGLGLIYTETDRALIVVGPGG